MLAEVVTSSTELVDRWWKHWGIPKECRPISLHTVLWSPVARCLVLHCLGLMKGEWSEVICCSPIDMVFFVFFFLFVSLKDLYCMMYVNMISLFMHSRLNTSCKHDGNPTDNSFLKGGYPLIYHVPSWFPPPPTSIPRNQCFPCVIYGFYEENEPLVSENNFCWRCMICLDCLAKDAEKTSRICDSFLKTTRGSSGRKNHCIFSLLTEYMCKGLTSMIFPEGRWLVVPVSSTAIALEIVHCPGGCAVSPSNILTKVCSQNLQLRKSHDWKMALDFLEKMNVSRVRPNIVPRFVGFSMSVPCWRATMLTQRELVDVLHPRNSRQIPEMMPYLKLEIDFPRPI